MDVVALFKRFQLSESARASGLSCSPDGVSLAGAPLLRKGAEGFRPRPPSELAALALAAYGEAPDIDRLTRGLNAASAALNRGDLGVAMVASLHLRLPEVGAEGAARVARVDDFLAKYDPNEPRDWRGRWTTGGGGAPRPDQATSRLPASRATTTPATSSAGVGNDPAASPPAKTSIQPSAVTSGSTGGDWGGPSHPTGGHLILTGGVEDDDSGNDNYGRNEPQWEDRPEPPEDPVFPKEKVPEGWDEDGERKPKLADGRPWPEATPAAVYGILQKPVGGRGSFMTIYIPRDGRGPILIGSNNTQEFPKPPGYDETRLEGIPQETKANGVPTRHAYYSVERALKLAETNRFEAIYFNRSFTTATNREVISPIRPDVLGVVRPELPFPYRFVPEESLSPRQTLEDRQLEMPGHVLIYEVAGDYYKLLRRLWAEYVTKLARLARWG